MMRKKKKNKISKNWEKISFRFVERDGIADYSEVQLLSKKNDVFFYILRNKEGNVEQEHYTLFSLSTFTLLFNWN
jgi:hypothetical protein